MSNESDDYWSLTDAEREYAALNLNEHEHDREKNISEMRQWILENKDLHTRTDDFYILRFLRGCKFDMKKAKMKFRNYHELRATVPEWFANRDPLLPELQEMFQMGVFLPLRKFDHEGRLVVIIRASVHDPSKHKQSNVFKAGKMILELASRYSKEVSLYGVFAIFDLDAVTLGHALQLPPAVIKRAVHSWQSCYPMRTNSMEFINAPVYVNFVLNVFRKFMNPKMKSRVHVHTRGLKNLHKKISPNILPLEYGGTDGTVKELTEYWKTRVENDREWFIEDEKYKMISTDNNSIKPS
ncbi:retinol-binding protein pinta isoform X1 [Neodiprion virginianus]|uniref:retinol-binding protein pinta isoform X1 n=2 Tax=Neodiprion virginianus TaxID=2961670 RepID=UPI001EE6FCB6|nr:retinol-binding protein pinta isoform X1 [Neodiprion virginianus]